jgi:anti-sigma factor RsiW
MIACATEPTPLEMRLSAFADGQLSDAEMQDVEAALINDPQARTVQDGLRRGSDLGRRLFDDMLREPVPLNLVRGIKNAPLPRKAVRLPSPQPPGMVFKPSGPQALAGCLVTLLLGAGLGYMIGTQPLSVTAPQPLPGQTAEARDWLDDIIAHYRLYARQPARLVEIGGDRTADILEWLTTGTGVTFRIPDLGSSGLSFVGARMIAADSTPTGVLIYRRTSGDADGDIVALTFSRTRPETSTPVEDIRIDTGMVSWSTPLATYVLVGPSSAADLDEVAAKAAGLI